MADIYEVIAPVISFVLGVIAGSARYGISYNKLKEKLKQLESCLLSAYEATKTLNEAIEDNTITVEEQKTIINKISNALENCRKIIQL